MRPVNKGVAPSVYSTYGNAQPDLVGRIGRFCSYCERFIASGIHVEHKRPKKRHPADELKWGNFLLACPNCNSCKGSPRVNLNRYLWPDTDNTLRAFEYMFAGRVRASQNLPKRLRRKANRTLRLFGLDKYPGHYHQPTARDLRWLDRRQQWDKAVLFRQHLNGYDTPTQRALAVQAASDGIFSIWWTVFANDIDMRRRLRQSFLGTDPASFDVNEKLVARPGGQL